MRKLFLLSLIIAFTLSCSKDTGGSDTPSTPSSSNSGSSGNSSGGSSSGCGYHNGKALHKGPDGGCYYINSNGNKTYVSRSECNC